MLRISLSVLVSVSLLGATARADTFGGWQYTAPPGYVVEVKPDHVELTKLGRSSFCSIAVFEARALDGSARAERAFEWHNIVGHSFKATVKRRATTQTRQGVQVAATTAALVDREGNEYAGIHYVVMPPGMIGSVLVTSTTPASLKRCERTAASVVGSLAIDWTSPRFTDPEARVETPEGRWAVVGPSSREYTFAPDGTYRFHSETPAAHREVVVDETGTYTVLGNQLTLRPVAATHALVQDGVARSGPRAPLEKTTYTWGKRYVVETNEWQLVLTPQKATARDGKLARDAAGYHYSDHARPAWKYAPQPGA